MSNGVRGNYVKMHRKRCGLSQRELAILLNYKDQWTISRHESGASSPNLRVALAYQSLFGTPVSAIFADLQSAVAQQVETNVATLEAELRSKIAAGHASPAVAQQLQWLESRKR